MIIRDKLLRQLPLLIISTTFFCFMSSANAQSVVSVSDEVLKDVAADELYWEVGVTCSGVDEPRLMQQRAGEVGWCALEIPQLCSENKDAIAEQLCSEEYELLTASDTPESEAEDASQSAAVEIASEAELVSSSIERVAPAPILPAPVVQEKIVETAQAPALAQQPIAVIQSEAIIDTPIITPTNITGNFFEANDVLMSAEEIAIEEELIRIEEQLLELRLKELELEQETLENFDE